MGLACAGAAAQAVCRPPVGNPGLSDKGTGQQSGFPGSGVTAARWWLPPPPPPALGSIENDLMTPSMKLKRPQLKERFQKDIDEMYKQLKAARR